MIILYIRSLICWQMRLGVTWFWSSSWSFSMNTVCASISNILRIGDLSNIFALWRISTSFCFWHQHVCFFMRYPFHAFTSNPCMRSAVTFKVCRGGNRETNHRKHMCLFYISGCLWTSTHASFPFVLSIRIPLQF